MLNIASVAFVLCDRKHLGFRLLPEKWRAILKMSNWALGIVINHTCKWSSVKALNLTFFWLGFQWHINRRCWHSLIAALQWKKKKKSLKGIRKVLILCGVSNFKVHWIFGHYEPYEFHHKLTDVQTTVYFYIQQTQRTNIIPLEFGENSLLLLVKT